MSTETNQNTGTATYCPEDNKLRLYIGRVPRPEYERLRAEGWKALHKQREAGGGDFVATWTPQRRDTALSYAGIIDDEDMGPAERAADRAERFGGYRAKRLGEATHSADRFDAGPIAHGFQSQERAEKAAARHDRIADRADDAWSKAEYWQRRTAGVIAHALHVSSPSVRMGRIKELEADIRRMEQNPSSYPNWLPHYRLRLAYENQMLEAQGGRAGVVEMIPGGWLRGGRHLTAEERQIVKVNKSNASGRVVSVVVRDNRPSHVNHYGNHYPEGVTKTLLHMVKVERMSPDAYRPPTAEELAAFHAKQKAAKAAAPKKPACPLVNPTDVDALCLQERINRYPRFAGDKPSQVIRMTQAEFSARIGHRCGIETICETGVPHRTQYGRNITRCDVYKVRLCSGEYGHAQRVVILTDKPQKSLPFEAVRIAREKQPTVDSLRPKLGEIAELVSPGYRSGFAPLLLDAQYVGLVSLPSLSQVAWTDAGLAEWKAFRAAQAVTV